MELRELKLRPQPWTIEVMEDLENKGLIKIFKPTYKVQQAEPGVNLVDEVYVSDEKYGPHKLITCGLNMDKIRLGVHTDNEEIFLPNLKDEVKPCYYIVSYLKEDEIREKDQKGSLSEDDFICLQMFPNPRGADMFTVLKGTVHCEVTPRAVGDVPYIFVTESRDLPITWIDLESHAIEVD